MEAAEFFKGKKITLMGLGVLGRGVGDALFLAECGAELIVTDLKTKEQLVDSIAKLKAFPNITFHLGGHNMKDFEDRDLVIKAAGVPLDSVYIEHAIEHNVPVAMSTALMAELTQSAGALIVGVTGTRGKSTVTQMIFEILKLECQRNQTMSFHNVHLGGNVRGLSTLGQLPMIEPGDVVVLELDSWQLQGFGDLRLSPHVGVFTTFLPDHMNYYGGSMKRYFADKANIFLNQKEIDTIVVGEQLEHYLKDFGYDAKVIGKLKIASAKNIPEDIQLQIPGEHNRYNAGLACEAARSLFVSEDVIKLALESFTGVPGRLQFLKEIGGVKIYNDNNATTPDATIAALQSFGETKNIILITGGSDKGLETQKYIEEITKHCKGIFLLGGTGTDRVKKEFPESLVGTAPVYLDIAKATQDAFASAAAGDILILSPGFASFGTFKNEYDRNDQFVEAVNKLK